MTSRTYRARTLRDALAQVRQDLGGNAVILGTHERRRRRFLGLGPRRAVVEVTAASGDTAIPAPMPAVSMPRPRPETAPAPQPGPASPPDELDIELKRLHTIVEDLSRQGRIDHLLPDLPSALVPIYADLLEVGAPESLAHRLVRRAADILEPDEAHLPEALHDALREAIEEILPIAPPIATLPGTRRVVALVGPTGVGKTTTVAKLAANVKLAQNLRVGLVTVDTYRIAAVEQLRTYAEIIDLPLAVANSPEEMPAAIASLGDVDLVLIDTAGRSPRDEVKIRELADFLAAAHPDEIHLVLSAVANERSLRAAVDRFAAVHADRLILTKLDEADGLGAALAVIGNAGLPVSYLTTGQAVPDDIETAARARLARLILGDDLAA